MLTHNQFIEKYDHQKVDIDNYPPGYIYQCTDVPSAYLRDVYGLRWRFIRGNGGPWDIVTDWPNSFVSSDQFELIQNNWNDVNQIPRQGDFMIFEPLGGDDIYGHIAIVHQAFPGQNRWIGFEQNGGGGYGQGTGEDVSKLRVHKYTASGGYAKIWGWLRRK